MEIRDLLLAFFTSDNYQPMRMKELADYFGLQGEERNELYEIIDQMLVNEEVKMSKKGKVRASSQLLRARKEEYPEKKEKTEKPDKQEEKQDKETDSKEKKEKENQDQTKDQDAEKEKNFPDFDVAYAAPIDEYMDDDQEEKLKDQVEDETEETVKDNEGILRGNSKGFAFFISDNKELDDTYIAPEDLNGALHGDRVRIKVTRKANPDRGFNQEGEVTHILERNSDTIVGTYEKRYGFGFVLPDEKAYFKDIYIDESNENGAQNNDKVIVKIDRYERDQANPEGHIEEILGQVGEAGVDITAIARKFELPYEFSDQTKEEVKHLPTEVSGKDRKGRRDLREKFTVTIDGPDAKDFDDAISVEKKGKFYNLYVHIADVSHYIDKGSAIDKDAYERGNSVYLLDRVIPMLPEELSNGLCSLVPEEDRLTMTAQLTMDHSGNIMDYQFYSSVINSDYRLIYDEVSDYLENGTRFNEDEELFEVLDIMYEIYEILAEKREQRGTVDFEFSETVIELDEAGKAIYVGKDERRVSNKIIEEFMVATNETIGGYFYEKKLPFIYRVHDYPSEEKIERLNKALYALQYEPVNPEPHPSELRAILEKAKGEKEEEVLNILVLQAMSKAKYSPSPDVHFGLAVKHYSHFTAPIRRYSDLIAHRLLKALLAEDPLTKDKKVMESLDKQCLHLSEAEIKAEDAERDVIDMKSAEYMQDYVGETFIGQVSSLTNFGVFIMLENTIEGLAHFRDMDDDYYTYDEEKFVVRGERTKKEIHYGDKVEVLVTKSNPELREIDFKILQKESDEKKSNKESQRKRRRTDGKPSTKPKNWTGGKISVTNQARKKGESDHRNRLSNKTRRKKTRKG